MLGMERMRSCTICAMERPLGLRPRSLPELSLRWDTSLRMLSVGCDSLLLGCTGGWSPTRLHTS